MTNYNISEAKSKDWPQDWALHKGAVNVWPLLGIESLPDGGTLRGQVREQSNSNVALLTVTFDPIAKTATVALADTAALGSLRKAWMVWDVMIGGVPHRFRQGHIDVEPDGSGQALSPTVVDLGTFQDLLDEATALVQQFVDDHGTMAAALATATAQATLATSERITVEGLQAIVNNTIADFNTQHGDFDTAIAAAEAQATIATTERQAAEAAAASLNAAAGFALDQLGAQSQSLTTSANLVGVAQIRYLDMKDYGISLRAAGFSELNISCKTGSIQFFNLDGTLNFTLTRASSPTPGRNWWRSSRTVASLAASSGFVFAGIDSATINGILFIDLITGELRRFGEDAAHTSRDLFLGDDLATDMQRAWPVSAYPSSGDINDLAARVLPGTIDNELRGLPDPTLVAATAAGLTIVRPSSTLDTPQLSNIAWGGGLDQCAISDHYVAASVVGGYWVYVWRHTVGDSSSGNDAAFAMGVGSELPLMELNITGVAFDEAGLLLVSHPTGMSLFKLGHNNERTLWRHKGAVFDTGWQRARSVLAVVGNSEQVNHAQGDAMDNGVGATVAKVEGTAGALTTEAVAAGADRTALAGFVHNDSYYSGTLVNAIGTSDFHLRVVLKTTGSSSIFAVGDSFGAALPSGGFLLHITGSLGINLYLANTISAAAASIPSGVYAFVDLVRDNGIIKIYVDGDYITEGAAPDDFTATGMKFGDGYWSKANQIAAVSLSLGVASQAEIKWMFEQDKYSYRQNAGVLVGVDVEPNAVAIDGRHTYTAHDGQPNDLTLIKWRPDYVVSERISPMALHSPWTSSNVNLLAANKGHLLMVGDDVSNYRPPITLPELAQQRVDYVHAGHGQHRAVTTNDGTAKIWQWPVPADIAGTKFAIEVWGEDEGGEEVARYYSELTLYRNADQVVQVDDMVFSSPVLSTSLSGFRNEETGPPYASVNNNVFTLIVRGLSFPVPPPSITKFYWTAQITRIS